MTFCLCSPHAKSLEYIFLQRLTRPQEQWTKLKLTRSAIIRYVTTRVVVWAAATQGPGTASGRRRGLCAAAHIQRDVADRRRAVSCTDRSKSNTHPVVHRWEIQIQSNVRARQHRKGGRLLISLEQERNGEIVRGILNTDLPRVGFV